MRASTYFHCERFAAAGVLTGEWAPFLVKRENVALEIKDRRVGPTTAFPGTPAHLPLRGVSLHMLFQVILAFKGFLADFTSYGLWWSRHTLNPFPWVSPRGKINAELVRQVFGAKKVTMTINPNTGCSVCLLGSRSRCSHVMVLRGVTPFPYQGAGVLSLVAVGRGQDEVDPCPSSASSTEGTASQTAPPAGAFPAAKCTAAPPRPGTPAPARLPGHRGTSFTNVTGTPLS